MEKITKFCTLAILLAISSALPQEVSLGYLPPPCPPINCQEIYKPVCGSDGKTYENDCTLRAAICRSPSLSKVRDGECGGGTPGPTCNDVCPANYLPVCGSDGRTYGNECELAAASCRNPSITKVRDGECSGGNPHPACSEICPLIFAPVCGSNGRTYPSECELNLAACTDPSIRKVTDGECNGTPGPTCNDVCPANYQPVCGSDGRTYGNECELAAASCRNPSITKVRDGECSGGTPHPACMEICPLIFAPVCGSNGRTYPSECQLNLAACTDPSIRKVKDGECGGSTPNPSCPDVCPAVYQPVCGSDGKTYGNGCELSIAACNNPSITQVRDGECRGVTPHPACMEICPAIFAPVCGSNGRTYPNECELNLAACVDPSINKIKDGECGGVGGECPTACPFNFAPVCGSNGETYPNECALNVAKCNNPSIAKLYDGECSNTQTQCPTNCPRDFRPVCGTDGVTYNNECLLSQVTCRDPSVTLAYNGECGIRQSCNQRCTREFIPVCGSNGQTYNNRCLLDTAACSDPSITLAHEGSCGAKPDCMRFCTKDFKPVCGSNGQTYPNKCMLEVAICNDPSISLNHEGQCNSTYGR